MRITLIALIFTALTMLGCSSDSGVELGSTDSEQSTTSVTNSPTSGLIAFFNGATFVLADEPGFNQSATDGTATDNWSVSFTTDTVNWNQSGVATEGTYSTVDDTNYMAVFPDQEISFTKNGSNIEWDARSYFRTATSKFDSQESLVTYFDDSTYESKSQLPIEGTTIGEQSMGNGSIGFNGDEFSWNYQDIIEIGTYSYIDGSSFKVSFSTREITVFVLDTNELVLDSEIYAQDFTDQFSSQETLVAYLDGASYKSVQLLSIGESANGATALGNWYIDFSDNTFTWTYQDVAEAGTYTYFDSLNFTAIFSNREFNVSVDGNDIIWDSVRYQRVPGN